MKLRLSDDAPDISDPFKGDLLERKQFASRLVTFLANVEGPFTMALTGPYGSGKTYFLRRCKLLLEALEVPVVLINAWETDFASEPIAPIVTELADKFSSHLKVEDRRWKKAKALAAKVAAATVPIGLKIATAGILEAEDFQKIAAVGDTVEKLAEKQFEHFAAAKKSVDGLRRELERLSDQIRNHRATGADRDSRSTPPPIIVLIDELDRCRPTYAIDFLEVVKHFFEITGIVFVMAIDRPQLVSAAQAVFGTGLDGDGYLRKFIDLECALPAPNIRNFCMNFLRSQPGIFRHDLYAGVEVPIAQLCQGAAFTIRRTQQFLVRAAVANAAASNIADPDLIFFFVFLRDYDPQLYNQFINERVSSWDILLEMRKLDPEFGYPLHHGGVPFVNLLIGMDNGGTDSFIDKLRQDYESKNMKSHIFDRFGSRDVGAWRPHIRQVTPWIDFCASVVV
jgi:hypothetical protein